jgi:hypothetical protein
VSGQQFPLLVQRVAWGEPRVFFHDPVTGSLRSLPTAWMDLAPPDPFVALSAGTAVRGGNHLDLIHPGRTAPTTAKVARCSTARLGHSGVVRMRVW